MTGVVVVGAGGFGRECGQYVVDVGKADETLELKGYIDDDPTAEGDPALGVAMLGTLSEYRIAPDDGFVVAVGDPQVRVRLAREIENRGGQLMSLTHPTAYVAPSARIGRHCILAPFSFVGPRVTMGDHCVVNVYASVAHDVTLGVGAILSPYVAISGEATLDDFVFLGTHSTVIGGKHIGSGAKVSAGSVIWRNVPADSLAAGNPARSRVLYR